MDKYYFIQLGAQVLYNDGTVHQEGVAGKMYGHKFRGQHSSKGMQEPKDTCP